MVTEKQKFKNRWISILLFSGFSFVLFINNLTDLFVKFGISYQMQWITWIGLIGTYFYTWWMASEDKI